MESTAETPLIDGVAAASQDENKDATNVHMNFDAAGTPVALKTRGALRHRMETTAEKVSPSKAGRNTEPPPKILGTPSSRLALSSETPRRSCRKSVRPAIDYDDIVRSAKKLIPEEHPNDEDDDESTAQKWNLAEVGRSNSRKRNRKSKRSAKNKQKTGDLDTGMPKDAGKEEELEKKEEKKEDDEVDEKLEILEENEEKSEILEENKEKSEILEENNEKLEILEENKEKSDILEENKEKPELQVETEVVSVSIPEDIDQIGETPLSQVCSDEPESETTKPICGTIQSSCKVSDEDIDELGLCPLSQESNIDPTEGINQNDEAKDADGLGPCSMEIETEVLKEVDEHNPKFEEDLEDMPSLIMIDDEESVAAENGQLNTTFDADDIRKDESVILVEGSPLQKPSIKVVLTTEDNTSETLLNTENSSPMLQHLSKKGSKGFRFPTPFKGKASFKFSDEHKTPFDNDLFKKCSSEMLDLKEPKHERRRSKSASHVNDVLSKTVSFQSPIEIASVTDIDKRWEVLNKKNITSRRKRSKSLEENPSKLSRIPKPIAIGKVVTPSKVKRAKLPNFAAIHEKQFSKMESLVDHVERKAERAKVLTNSALKLASGTKKHQATSLKEDYAVRPKALKKIELSAKTVAPLEASKEKALPSRLPLKNAANGPSRPAFNLSTSVGSSFNTTLSSRPALDKLAERKQRHMEMFKGRTTDKNKRGDLIKGVRSNRRFELQMQHRRHITEE
ncbi:uncharacterized protein Dana_GF16313, isoform B [Drosophila ananassae]|uniref:Uncharacterized protein, isoform B n=1 Tax=Drosophila ananassae TaxID=7217 RepID=A0A0P8Y158_DROAN|nr:uncharacterized protein Dana_GF16313, isoform B [Drosophila ananassae]